MKIPVPRKCNHPACSYYVHVPSSLSGVKQRRKYFKTKREAERFCKSLMAEAGQLGSGFLSSITEEEKADVFRFLQERRRLNAGGKKVRDLFEEFCEFQGRRGLSWRYLHEIKYQGGKLADAFGDRKLQGVEGHEIVDWVNGLDVGPTAKFDAFKIARLIFNHGVFKKYCAVNPCAGLTRFIERPNMPKGILKPGELSKLLKAADGEAVLPWLVFGAFAGLRPVEVERLEWKTVDLKKKEIYIPPSAAKQVKRSYTEGRVVPILPTMGAWLKLMGRRRGKILACSSMTLRRRKAACCKKVRVKIPHDALRHSFGTYHYAAFQNGALTAAIMGHSQTDVTFRHYARRDISRHEAEKWWGLRPGKE